jgi:hypothetical protein
MTGLIGAPRLATVKREMRTFGFFENRNPGSDESREAVPSAFAPYSAASRMAL